jgi:hypothetical protein
MLAQQCNMGEVSDQPSERQNGKTGYVSDYHNHDWIGRDLGLDPDLRRSAGHHHDPET